MTLQPAVAPSESPLPSRQTAANNWLVKFDALAALPTKQPLSHWANRVVLFGLFLFTLAIPHSIFAANFGLNLSLLAWVIRGVTLRNFYFRRTPLDRPLLWFVGLTVLSAIFSIEPAVSLPKLKSLLLFGVLYLFASNLKPSAAPWLLGVLLCSSLTGVGFSLFEKVYGRGMVIASIANDTPLSAQFPGDQVLPGDVIWMIGKQRVHSVTEAAKIIRNHKDGEQLEVETLRAGDPLPVKLLVTPALKKSENPLGITTSGRTRRFRVSGFTRQFLTYAEQMQMLALLCYGCLLSALAQARPRRRWSTPALLFGMLLLLFSLTLAMTASRAVIAAFLFALTVVSLAVGGRRTQVAALILIVLLGGFSVYVISTARQAGVISFNDDSSARRLAYMRAGFKLIPQHPWLGVGQDAHKLHWQEWGFPGNYVTHMHSTPIQLALDRGLPALGCYVWLLATMLSQAWRGYRFRQMSSLASSSVWPTGLQLGTFGALLGFSFSSLANYNFGDSEVLLLLLLLVGLLLMNHQPDVSDEPLPATSTS